MEKQARLGDAVARGPIEDVVGREATAGYDFCRCRLRRGFFGWDFGGLLSASCSEAAGKSLTFLEEEPAALSCPPSAWPALSSKQMKRSRKRSIVECGKRQDLNRNPPLASSLPFHSLLWWAVLGGRTYLHFGAGPAYPTAHR